MVVSYRTKIFSLVLGLILVLTPVFSFAETAQIISDNELDTITGAALPNNFTDSLTNQLENTLNHSLSSLDTLGTILNSGLFSSGLTNVHAEGSTVLVQTNIAFFLQTPTGDIHQSNTAFISN